MVYYMLTEKITEEMNIRRDELAAIEEQLKAKYPATRCSSYNEREAYGMEKYHMEMYAFCTEYKRLSAAILEDRRAHGLEVLTRSAGPMMGKTKAVLVRECARRMKVMGVREAWVENWVYSEGRYWYPTQSWYVYEDGGQYYFKMTKSCKATHKIEGVA